MALGQREIIGALDAWAGREIVMVSLVPDPDWPMRPFVGKLRRVEPPDPEGLPRALYSVLTEPPDPRLHNPDGVSFAVLPIATGTWIGRKSAAGLSVIQGVVRTDFWLSE